MGQRAVIAPTQSPQLWEAGRIQSTPSHLHHGDKKGKKIAESGWEVVSVALVVKGYGWQETAKLYKDGQMQVNDRPAVQLAAQIIFLILAWWLNCSASNSEILLTHLGNLQKTSVAF